MTKMKLKTTLHLEKQFTFYASYHSQPVNVAIHLVCIWTILATALLLLQFSPSLVASPSCFNLLPFGDHANVNLSLVFSLVYVVCYIIMEPFAGTLGAGLVGAIYLYSGYLVNTGTLVLGYSIWKVALAIHVTAWILQFIGHGVFEGRAPALLDSLDQVNGSKIKVYVNKVNRVNAFSCDKVIFSYQILNFSSTVSTPDEPY